MKSKLTAFLVALFFSLSLAAVSNVAQAGYGCRWIPGHWEFGRWIPGHRVCWGYGRGYYWGGCRWIPGHWYGGYWIPGRRVCW